MTLLNKVFASTACIITWLLAIHYLAKRPGNTNEMNKGLPINMK